MENKKKLILIGSIVVILVSITSIIYMLTRKEEEPTYTIDGIDLVEKKDILNDRVVSNLDITNVSLLTRNGISSYKATISNNTDEDITISNLYVVFYQEEEKIKMLALSDTIIKVNNMTYIGITSETDLSKTTKIEYVLE